MQNLRRLSWSLIPLVVLAAPPALADNGPELWYQLENRVTLPGDVAWRPKSFRFITVNFWGARFPGLGQALVRMGPIWELNPNLSVGLNLVPGMEQNNGVINQQFRLEAEPVLRWDWAGLAFTDRTRLERRWAQQGNLWRIRNQLRLSFPALGWEWTPYVSNEGFYDLTAQEFNQNRTLVGFSRSLTDDIRLDLSYLLRFRLSSGAWDRDHALSISFTVNHKVEASDLAPGMHPDP